MILHKIFTEWLWKVASVYLSGGSLEEMYELLEGSFLNDDVDFNKELDDVTSAEEIDDKKKVFKCTLCGKECVSSRGLNKETNKSETCPGRSYIKRTKKVLIVIDEVMNLVKKFADSCNEDLKCGQF